VIIPTALNACTVESGFCTDRGENNVPSDHHDSSALKLDSATHKVTSIVSNYCGIGYTNLKSTINRAESGLQIINDQEKTFQFLRDHSDPFGNIPTLDPQFTLYVLNSCYKQDRKVMYRAILGDFLISHILCNFSAFSCVGIAVHCIFQTKRNLADITFLLACFSSLQSFSS
jgi:hypothetical protein